ncbi:MAG TPA: hypothetical protein ENH92_04850 [Ectothiorhodospiraceae bacterium]|nr:MAG: hypothetical protein DRO03_03790 [Methanosarcinales archaeon]HEA26431.1 hypothetical protein [Ectothiorhodospiraceae bacterium]
MITVSDSTPLIHFGTIKQLHLLRSMYGQIVITEAVHREVVTEGIAPGMMDANLFGKGDEEMDLQRQSFGCLMVWVNLRRDVLNRITFASMDIQCKVGDALDS